jgi:hypothetical protein
MKRLCGLIGLLAMPGGLGWAAPLELHYGANEVDINGDGVKDLIVKLRWDNGNAHSFDRYLIGVYLDGEWYDRGFYEVPKDTLDSDYRFHTTEGADCLRVGYKFWLDSKHVLMVKRYMLEEGHTYYCEAEHGTETTYRLTDITKETSEDFAGFPPVYLKKIKEIPFRKKYESVEELMK